ncbi:hypothetical protein HYZ64_00510 [Candidatus Berkelbacteria bacterium]|nr:hypothetical protein [Candidatus Berkelbacteria bacterium]
MNFRRWKALYNEIDLAPKNLVFQWVLCACWLISLGCLEFGQSVSASLCLLFVLVLQAAVLDYAVCLNKAAQDLRNSSYKLPTLVVEDLPIIARAVGQLWICNPQVFCPDETSVDGSQIIVGCATSDRGFFKGAELAIQLPVKWVTLTADSRFAVRDGR